MVKENQDDGFFAGNDRRLEFTLTDDDSDLDPKPPLSLIGLTIKWALSPISKKSGKFSVEPILEKSSLVSSEIEITDAPAGECAVILTPADSVNLSGIYYQELEAFDSFGGAVVQATGEITIERNVNNT